MTAAREWRISKFERIGFSREDATNLAQASDWSDADVDAFAASERKRAVREFSKELQEQLRKHGDAFGAGFVEGFTPKLAGATR